MLFRIVISPSYSHLLNYIVVLSYMQNIVITYFSFFEVGKYSEFYVHIYFCFDIISYSFNFYYFFLLQTRFVLFCFMCHRLIFNDLCFTHFRVIIRTQWNSFLKDEMSAKTSGRSAQKIMAFSDVHLLRAFPDIKQEFCPEEVHLGNQYSNCINFYYTLISYSIISSNYIC